MGDTTAQWKGTGWAIAVSGTTVAVETAEEGLQMADPSTVASMSVRRSWFRWFLHADGHRAVRLRGLSSNDASQLGRALRRAALSDHITSAVEWDRRVRSTISTASTQQRWLAREQIDELVAARPQPGLAAALREARIDAQLTDEERSAAAALDSDIAALFGELNERIAESELRDRRRFFDSIEKTPLTDEQARAVVCFDNRVHLVAAAGSGKTSVMVARAAYAVSRGFVRPDQILLLAFNRDAANELQERIEARFAAAGLSSEGVRASTFHSFGLDVIGRATNAKPRLAPWLDAGKDTDMVERIVDELRDADPTFRYRWDLYRLMFAAAPTDPADGTPDGYDRSTKQTGFETFGGDVVKSAGERMIADWLFINGVEYRYEHRYSVDTATATRSEYRPDFYYPAVDVWHEHWALGRDGKPPAEFRDYANGMEWKRRLHAQHGTRLVESTFADVVFGDGLQKLQADLEAHGVVFDWNPDRSIPSRARPMDHKSLARLMRTFMAHVKSNSLTAADIDARLGGPRSYLAGYRTRLFLDLYWPIHNEWNRRLRAENHVDFEDMLVLAADHLESGQVDMGYQLVLVDEFQDASHARARLVRGLLREPGRFLLAVGDDWQAINRFAGADISVMLQFEDWFGVGEQLALTTTFRCPQSICDVASEFVQRNPRQFRKTVRSAQSGRGEPVTLIQTNNCDAALASYLQRLSAAVASGEIAAPAGRKVSVDVLGRYNFDRKMLPYRTPANLTVTFRTAHRSKGLEADYIVIPRAASGRYGFPSEIADDPVLDVAMAAPDPYPNAEDRRLFYVALTRARRQVTVIFERGRESSFIAELAQSADVVAVDDQGQPMREVEVCRTCGQGTMIIRKGPHGKFLACSRFPACTGKRSLR